MARADDLGRDVNRLYWETEEPVTRLAEQLSVSRGTFYNHLRPLPAGSPCPSCGAPMLFRNRSSRDSGDASCAECGTEKQLKAAARGGRSTPSATIVGGPRRGASLRSGGLESAVSRVRARFDDAQKTQLLLLAVGAAALGLGLLYYSRHRS